MERAYNDFWWDFGTRIAKQTSLVVDPPDGRIPPLTAEAQQRIAAARGADYDNPEERPLAERCILGFNSGPPMVPSAYNNNVQLVQTRDHVVIVNEMIHSARIVDLTRRAASAESDPLPDRRFHWPLGGRHARRRHDQFFFTRRVQRREPESASRREFTRLDRHTLRYEFTVDDPATWTKAWTASIPMTRTDELMFEYACHEANYALEGVLKGARYQEKQPKASK